MKTPFWIKPSKYQHFNQRRDSAAQLQSIYPLDSIIRLSAFPITFNYLNFLLTLFRYDLINTYFSSNQQQMNSCVLFLHLIIDDESIWESVIDLPSDRVVCYRYLIVSVEPTTEITHIRSWETHLEPREVKLVAAENNKVDTYGDVDGVEKIERGWLTSETIVQFKFFNNPFMLKEKQKNKQLLVKVQCDSSISWT